MNRIEVASRSAKSATYAAVDVDDRRTAMQAAACFFFDLLFGERQTIVGKRFVFCVIDCRHLTFASVVRADFDIVTIEFDELAQIS